MLDDSSAAERDALTSAWLAQVEEAEAEMEGAAQRDDASPRGSPRAAVNWWIPPTWHTSGSNDSSRDRTAGSVGYPVVASAQVSEVPEVSPAVAAADGDDTGDNDAGDDEEGTAEVAE